MDTNCENEMDLVDGTFLRNFGSMGTTDKDVLISQFQSLLGFQLNPAGCAFFLDMANWNLQSAIGAYYDFEGGPLLRCPSMSLVSDVTVGEGEAIPPSTAFVKSWKIRNNGNEAWPFGCCLRFLMGEQMGAPDSVNVPSTPPGVCVEVSLNMISPSIPGIYQGQWRMHTSSGVPFGEIIWVIITVEHEGLLGITQQISRVGRDISESQSQCNKTLFESHEHSMDSSEQTDIKMSNVTEENCCNFEMIVKILRSQTYV